jgi:hypothetical protein
MGDNGGMAEQPIDEIDALVAAKWVSRGWRDEQRRRDDDHPDAGDRAGADRKGT